MQLTDLQTVAAEGSFPYDPQTNGAVESAVKVIKQSMRANLLTLRLERRLQARMLPTHVVVAWLVRHSTIDSHAWARWKDGLYERARWTACTSKLLGFGEVCRYSRSQEGHIAGTSQRFSIGVWLGIDLRTGQYILWDPKLEGIRYTRS